MITVLTGDNDFELKAALNAIEQSFGGAPERIDGSSLTLNNIPDLLMGVSLFAEERLVIIDQLSSNAAVWSKLPDWLSRLSDTIHLVLLEPALDKRTTVYKALKSAADIQVFSAWTPKDAVRAETWTAAYAKEQGVALSRQSAAYLVRRVGMNQWQLSQAVKLLELTGAADITPEVIDAVIVPSAEESVFQLLDDALNGNAEQVSRTIQSLVLSEDPHRLTALVVSQVYSLAATVLAPVDADPAKDFGVHPFVISKLKRFKSSLGANGALRMIAACADADTDLKSSRGEPWVLVEQLLLKIAHRSF